MDQSKVARTDFQKMSDPGWVANLDSNLVCMKAIIRTKHAQEWHES